MVYEHVTVTGGELSEKEMEQYVAYVQAKQPKRKLKSMEIKLDGEYVDLSYEFEPMDFERIRRITGYLVGTLDRFNDAKRAEVEDRLKHSVGCGMCEI